MIEQIYRVSVGSYSGVCSTLEEAEEMEHKFEIYENDKCTFTAQGEIKYNTPFSNNIS